MLKQWTLKFACVLFAFGLGTGAIAQLDTLHWIPPLHSRDNAQIEDHYLYLSTPIQEPVTVTIADGSGNAFPGSPFTIENGSPLDVSIGNGQTSGSKLMVSNAELNTTLTNRGLIVSSSAPIFCNARYRSNWQAEALTSKGTKAQGQLFRLGGMPITYEGGLRSFVFGIMATEDDVQIQISDYDNGVVFAGVPTNNTDVLTFSMNAGECRVYSAYANSSANLAGVLGALIESSGNIVINVGNWCGSVGTTSSNQDIGADQIVPTAYLGKEHILVEGIGDPNQERGFVVAVEPNTDVFLNGSAAAVATLQPGEWLMTDNSDYTGVPHGNLFLQTSKPAYVYQFLGGSSSQSTPGMNFIPPISCGMPYEVNEIPDIQSIGNASYTGGIFAITEAGATLSINGEVQSGAVEVNGYENWETYRILGLSGDIAVASTGPVAVGLFGSSADAGFSGYYSGFSLNINAAFVAPAEVCWDNDAFVEFAGDTIGGGILTWNFGDLTVEALGDDLFEVSTENSGIFPIELYVSGDLCADSSLQEIVFYPAYAGVSDAIACGEYQWNDDIYTETGIFNDVLTSATGCDSLVQLELEIMPIPVPIMQDWSDDTLVYCPSSGSLLFGLDADPIYQLQWVHWPEGTEDSLLLASNIAAAGYVGPGVYQLDYFTGPPCNYAATGLIEVSEDDCEIIIPNVFSPNGDGQNDRFRIPGLKSLGDVRMQVYNRWGSLLFTDLDFGSSAGWDPRLAASEGTYYFILEIPITGESLTVTSTSGVEFFEGPTTAIYNGAFSLVR
jgi:gliding motility-associated-like protein